MKIFNLIFKSKMDETIRAQKIFDSLLARYYLKNDRYYHEYGVLKRYFHELNLHLTYPNLFLLMKRCFNINIKHNHILHDEIVKIWTKIISSHRTSDELHDLEQTLINQQYYPVHRLLKIYTIFRYANNIFLQPEKWEEFQQYLLTTKLPKFSKLIDELDHFIIQLINTINIDDNITNLMSLILQ